MSDKAKYGLKGDKDLEKQLIQLDTNVGMKLMRRAGRKAAKPMKQDMEANANRSDEEGVHMADSIKMTTSSRSRSSNARFLKISVGPSKEHNQKAVAQEFGTSKQQKEPFIRPAGRKHKAGQERVLISEVNKALKDVTRKSR